MKPKPQHAAPADGDHRLAVEPVICYPIDTLPQPDMSRFEAMREGMTMVDSLVVPPREARTFRVPAGHFLRLTSLEGPQVGDLNLWADGNLNEKFYTGKTRALHGTHVSTGDQLWSSFPYLRPLATITKDTLDWYGFDEFGGSVHDVIGTRCDPYTAKLLSGDDYHHCCHSNLCRAVAEDQGFSMEEAEKYVHDVLNVFMCTGFTRDTQQYFMKASPVRPGDFLEMIANVPLYGALSACPGGDCSTIHSSDIAQCHPLGVEIWKPADTWLSDWKEPAASSYALC
ncbi:MAG: urea carboxylase-associated family protein [Alphaproteobacteria bacterium]